MNDPELATGKLTDARMIVEEALKEIPTDWESERELVATCVLKLLGAIRRIDAKAAYGKRKAS